MKEKTNETIEQKALDYARTAFGWFKQELSRERKKKISIEPPQPLLWDTTDVALLSHKRAHALYKLEKIFSLGVVVEYSQLSIDVTVHFPEELTTGDFLNRSKPLWEPILKNVFGCRAQLRYLFYLTEYPTSWKEDIEKLNNQQK